jgi:uncharacterized membrane protein YdjX (TVP38/TMEM64 family)
MKGGAWANCSKNRPNKLKNEERVLTLSPDDTHNNHTSGEKSNENLGHDHFETATAQPQPRRRIAELIALVLGFVVFLAIATLAINAIGVPQLQAFIQQAGPLAPLAYIALKALTYIFAPLTSGPIQVFAGTLFGNVWLGVLYTLIGEVIGGSISFWIARKFGRPMVLRFVGKDGMKQVDDFYQNRLGGWQALAIARVVLFSFWDFLSYAAGLAPVKFRSYVWVSAVFGVLPTFLFVWLGDRFAGNTGAMIVSYGVLIVLTLIPILLLKPISALLENLSKPKI